MFEVVEGLLVWMNMTNRTIKRQELIDENSKLVNLDQRNDCEAQ